MTSALYGFARSDLEETLKTLLADTIHVYLHAHGFHWNVKGPDFSQYHALFADIYSDILGAVDPTAECLLKIGADAPYTSEALGRHRSIPDIECSDDPRSMTATLLELNNALIESIKAAYKAANEEDDQGIVNFLAGRLDMHAKWSWQLRASAM